MSLSDAQCQELILKGELNTLISLSYEHKLASHSHNCVPWFIAAFCFQSKIAEANSLFKTYSEKLSAYEKVVAQFFLGIGESRLGNYAQSRSLFVQNLQFSFRLRKRSTENDSNAAILFFAWQGASYFRQMHCRYASGLISAQKSYHYANIWGAAFAQLLSSDHLGHMLVRTGSVALGIEQLQDALNFANEHKYRGFSSSIATSILNYQVQFGVEPEKKFSQLLQSRSQLSITDSYSKSYLYLEISRQFLLRGNGIEASQALHDISLFVAEKEQRRVKCVFHLRRASVSFWNGEFENALVELDKLEILTDPNFDWQFILESKGLRSRCLQELEIAPPTALLAQIRTLTQKTGTRIAQNILSRQVEGKKNANAADDFLGELLDRVEAAYQLGSSRFQGQALIHEIMACGFLLLLPRLLGLKPGTRAVVFNIVDDSVAVFNGGQIHIIPNSSSPQIRLFLLTLKRGKATKKDLVEIIWGYRYNAEIHDSLVHALTRRIRILLKEAANWILLSQGVYSLHSEIEIKLHEPGIEHSPTYKVPLSFQKTPSQNLSEINATDANSLAPLPKSELNHRQILILEFIEMRRFASLQEIISEFKVSKATAHRDVTELLRLHKIQVYGVGPATRYGAVG